jgi:cell wall-associated NlpC family hydrolase
MITDEMREKIVTEAKTWVGTRYHHLADIKGHGVDCAMLLIRVYCGLGLAPAFDPRPYETQWYFHHSEEKYLEWIKKYCDPVERGLPGDIEVYRFGRCAAHGTIIISEDMMIHAYQPARVVEVRERWAGIPHGKLDSIWTVRT